MCKIPFEKVFATELFAINGSVSDDSGQITANMELFHFSQARHNKVRGSLETHSYLYVTLFSWDSPPTFTLFLIFLSSLLQILVSLFFVFWDLVCVIFFTIVFVCKARQAKLLKNVNKHFRNFVRQNQQNRNKNGMKWSNITYMSHENASGRFMKVKRLLQIGFRPIVQDLVGWDVLSL